MMMLRFVSVLIKSSLASCRDTLSEIEIWRAANLIVAGFGKAAKLESKRQFC